MGFKIHDAIWHKDRRECLRRDRMCTGKIKHEHMGTALQHAMSLRRKSLGASIGMYDCEYCGFGHVGNKKSGWELTDDHET